MKKLWFRKEKKATRVAALELVNAKLEAKMQELQEERRKVELLEKRIDELRLQIPSKFPVEEVMDTCSAGAWNGGRRMRTFKTDDGTIVRFEGTVYEEVYEFFTAGCNVYLDLPNGKTRTLYEVYSRTVAPYRKQVFTLGSIEEVRNWISENTSQIEECV